MNRRNFLKRSAITASAVPTISVIVGCSSGGGSSSKSKESSASSSKIAVLVSSLQESKKESDSLHSDNNIAISSAASRSILKAPSLANNFFSSNTPSDSYLGSDTWSKYASYNSLAYDQFTHQFTKLTAALRLYDSKNSNSASKSPALSSPKAQLSPALADNIDVIDKLIEKITSGISENTLILTLDTITAILKNFNIDIADTDDLVYTIATYLSIDKLLKSIQKKSTVDLDFASSEGVMISLAKMSIASIALMGSLSLEKLSDAKQSISRASSLTNISSEDIEAYLSGASLQNSLVMMLMNFIGNYIDNTLTLEGKSSSEVQAKLATQSTIMATISIVLKALFAMISSQAIDSKDSGFTAGSDADAFSILFGADTLPQDEAFSSFMSNFDTSSFADITALVSTLKTEHTIKTVNTRSTANSEESAFKFASSLSDSAYEFTAQTETDAYNFADDMAGDAYEFAMTGMGYAYNFAMQGMEYGYLFASQGEDVGVMADRIMWMAAQIGLMADRIGEMGDRIVYTEQLIVYTETLILDFGLLIYGAMKMVTNGSLTALALILDREWYEADKSDDQIVTLIGDSTWQMMDNMQEYIIRVLRNQDDLREISVNSFEAQA